MTAKSSSLVSFVYDGLTDPRVFKQNFNIFAASNDWNAAKQLAMLPLLLKEKAERVYKEFNKKTEGGEDKSCAVLMEELITKCEQQHETLLYQFYERKRDPSESISHYATVLHELLVNAMPGLSKDDLSSLLRAQLCLHVPENMRVLVQFSATFGTSSWDDLLACLDKTCPSSLIPTASGTRWDAYSDPSLIKSEFKSESIDANWSDTRGSRNDQRQNSYSNNNNNNRQTPNRRFEGTCDFCHFYGHKISDCRKRMRIRNESNSDTFRPNNSFRNNASSSNQRPTNYSYNTPQRSQLNSCEREHVGLRPSLQQDQSFNDDDWAHVQYVDLQGDVNENEIESDQNNIEVIELNNLLLTKLIKIRVSFSLFGGAVHECIALGDTGSTHSFFCPRMLITIECEQLRNNRNQEVQRKIFAINGATGSVNSECLVTKIDLSIGKWNGSHSFVVSEVVHRYDMVLGKDFFDQKKIILDFSNNTFNVGDQSIDMNSILVEENRSKHNESESEKLIAARAEIEALKERLNQVNLNLIPINSNAMDLLGIEFKSDGQPAKASSSDLE